jgi:hypothetical protein
VDTSSFAYRMATSLGLAPTRGCLGGSRFRLQYEAIFYINLISFKNIFNINNKQSDLSKCILKTYNFNSTFLEHLTTYYTNFTKFSREITILNRI